MDDYDDDEGFVHIPNPPPAPNIVNEGAGPNIVPEGDDSVQAPEGVSVPPAPNICRTCGKAWKNPPGRWIRGADGRMECINMFKLAQHEALEMLNRDIYALTFGNRQIDTSPSSDYVKEKEEA